MGEVLISDRPRFGRESLLWRDSDEVWHKTKPHLTHFAATSPQPGAIHTVCYVTNRRPRTLRQRIAEALYVFKHG